MACYSGAIWTICSKIFSLLWAIIHAKFLEDMFWNKKVFQTVTLIRWTQFRQMSNFLGKKEHVQNFRSISQIPRNYDLIDSARHADHLYTYIHTYVCMYFRRSSTFSSMFHKLRGNLDTGYRKFRNFSKSSRAVFSWNHKIFICEHWFPKIYFNVLYICMYVCSFGWSQLVKRTHVTSIWFQFFILVIKTNIYIHT